MPPLSLKFKSTLATVCYIVGLSLAVYLALLKFFALPCVGPGRCQEILYSKYGSVFDIPVGVFGALLWLGIIFVRNRDKRDLLLLMLAAGTAFFMVVQFFVLRGFCLYCTLHAVAAWCALFLHHEKRRLWTPLAAFALAGVGLVLARGYAASHAQNGLAPSAHLARLPDSPSALAWLGPIHPRSPAVVLSLDCPACLDLLDSLTKTSYKNQNAGPALFFKTNDANRLLTECFLAAVLSQGDLSRRDALLATATTLLSHREIALNDPGTAAARLASLFPAAAEKKNDAEKIVEAQARALTAAKTGDATPLLVTRAGEARVFFKTADLFP